MHARTLTRVVFEQRIIEAQPGDKIVYHVGHLGRDRKSGPDFLAIENTAQAARQAFEDGKVTLVQHRVMPDIYEYVAIAKGEVPCGASCGA